MLKKRSRLSREAFGKAFKQSRRIKGDGFVLLVSPSPSSHAAVVVSKKVAKRAVWRNRIRRVVYDAVARSGLLTRGSTVIVLISPPTTGVLCAQYVRTLRESVERVCGEVAKR